MKPFGSSKALPSLTPSFAQSELVPLVPCGQREFFHQTTLLSRATLHWRDQQKPRKPKPEERKVTEIHSLTSLSNLQILTEPILKQVQGNWKKSQSLYSRNSSGKGRQVTTWHSKPRESLLVHTLHAQCAQGPRAVPTTGRKVEPCSCCEKHT